MMPIGTPRVPYRTPGEGTWQWVDLWNALVSVCNSLHYKDDRVVSVLLHIYTESLVNLRI